jgi:hypothetical protein
MRTTIAIALLLGACSNLGPFRAHGDGDGDDDASDGGITSDGRAVDGALADGTNTVTPTKLVSAGGRPIELAVSSGYVYWTQLDDSKIGRVAKSGGAAQTIAAGGIPQEPTTRDADIYWVASDGIHHASDGSFTASAALYTSTDILVPLAISANDIYFFEDGIGVGNDKLRTLARAGGTPQLIRSDLDGPRTLSIDGSSLYVAHGLTLEKSALATPTSTSLIDAVSTGQLATAAGRACWVTHPDPNVQTREIWCAILGGKQKIATAAQQVMSIAMSSSALFWIAQDNTGTTQLWSYDFVTGVKSPLWQQATGTYALSLAVDASTLYWLTTTDDVNGEIWQVPL